MTISASCVRRRGREAFPRYHSPCLLQGPNDHKRIVRAWDTQYSYNSTAAAAPVCRFSVVLSNAKWRKQTWPGGVEWVPGSCFPSSGNGRFIPKSIVVSPVWSASAESWATLRSSAPNYRVPRQRSAPFAPRKIDKSAVGGWYRTSRLSPYSATPAEVASHRCGCGWTRRVGSVVWAVVPIFLSACSISFKGHLLSP